MTGELLGVSVLELRTNQAPLDSGLASARTKTMAASKDMGAAWDTVGKRVANVGNHMSVLGSRMTTNVTAPIIAGAAGAIKVASDFEGALTQIETQAGASRREIDNMRGAILKLAPAVGETPTNLANALFHIESAGMRGAKALDTLTASAKLAQIGHADLETTTNGLVAVMASAPKDVGNATQAIGLLNATVGAGNLRMNDLVGALATGIIPAAKAAGLGLQDVGAAIDVMTKRGIPANDAATRLRMTFSLMEAPTSAAAKALGSVGISSSELANDMRKPDGLVVAVQDLKKHLDDAGLSATQQTQVITKAFGGGRSSSAILTLLQNVNDLQGSFEKIGKSSGAKQVSDEWKTTQGDLSFRFDQMKAEAEKAGIEIGQSIGPEILKIGGEIAKDAASVAHGFSTLPKSTQDMILKGGLLVAAIGPALKIAGVFTTGIGRLYDAAKIAENLAVGKGLRLPGSSSAAARSVMAGTTSVATMEVGTLVAKGIVGGEGGSWSSGSWNASGTKAGQPKFTNATSASVAAEEESAGASESGGAALTGIGGRLLGDVGLALLAAPLGLALGSVVSKWIRDDALSEGRAWADKFTAPLPDAVRKSFRDPLAETRTRIPQDQLRTSRDQVRGAGVRVGKQINLTAPSSADLKQVQRDYFNEGWEAGKATISGLQSVHMTSAPIVISDFMMQLRKLPARARPEAARVMIQFAEGLEQQGKLPKRSVDGIIASLEQSIPGLGRYLYSQGLTTDRDFARALKFTAATSQLRQTLANYRTQFGDLSISTNITGQNIDQNVATAMQHLRDSIGNSIGDARRTYVAELKKLQAATNSTFDDMASKVTTRAGEMKNAISSGSQQAASTAWTNFNDFVKTVDNAMSAGVLTTGRGGQLIAKALNATLKALGDSKAMIPIPALLASTGLGTTLPQSSAIGSQGGFKVHGAAQGALMQVGHAGARGRDTVPLNVGGTPIMVGSGEQVAVFNNTQQRVMNSRLADYGGLPGFFSRVNRPNYMAGGGLVPGFSTGGLAGQPSGTLSYSQLEGLWDKAGGKQSMAPLMAAIAEAESSGDITNRNSSGASGLWQILMPSNAGYVPGGAGNVFNPLDNAIAAVRILKSQGLGAWVTYTSGAYKQFLHGNVPASAAGLGGGAAAAAFKQIKTPGVSGAGPIAEMARAALRKGGSAANAYERAHMPAPAVGAGGVGAAISGGGATSGPAGLATFEGVLMSQWIANELEWATKHGWHGQPTSGYRPGRDPNTPTGASEHALIAYPGGAVDFGGPVDPAAYHTKLALVELAARLNYPGPRLKMPVFTYNPGAIGGGDDGHLSGDGHARGGLVNLLRAFAGGGHVDGSVAKPTPAQMKRFGQITHGVWNGLRSHNFLPAGATFPNINVSRAGLSGDEGIFARAFTDGRTITWPWGMVDWAEDPKSGSNYDWAQESLVHEFAHTMQSPATLASQVLREGGAQAWADQRSASVLADWMPWGDSNYAGYVDYVKKNKGLGWIDQGQFRKFAGGGLVSFPGLHQDAGSAQQISDRDQAYQIMQKLWMAGRSYYPGAGASMPPTYLANENQLFVGDAYDPNHPAVRNREIVWPQWMTSMLLGKADKVSGNTGGRRGTNDALETIIHEWAHQFQAPAVIADAPTWLLEGGADGFARMFAGRIMSGAGIKGYSDPGMALYNGYVSRVHKQLGDDWIRRVQFTTKKLPKLAGGGFLDLVKTLPAAGGQLADVMTYGSIDSAGNSGGFNQAGSPFAFGKIPSGPSAGPWWAEGDRRSSIGHAFGGKPGGQAMRVSADGKSTVVYKADTGDGNSYGDIYPPSAAIFNPGFMQAGHKSFRVQFITDDEARKLITGGKAATGPKSTGSKVTPDGFGAAGWLKKYKQLSPLAGASPLINEAFTQLNGILDPDSGSVAKLQDEDQALQNIFATTPFGNIATAQDALVTNPDGTSSIDQGLLQGRIKQLTQLYGLEVQAQEQLQLAKRLIAGPLLQRLAAAIKGRQLQIANIRKRIQENLRRIKRLMSMIAAEKKRTFPSGKAGNAARAASKSRVTGWNSQITSLKTDNASLGGDKDKVGTGGQIGTLQGQIKTLTDTQSTVTQDKLSVEGASGIGGALGDATVTVLSRKNDLSSLSPQALGLALAAADLSSSGGSTSTTTDQLNSNLEQENGFLQQRLVVSQDQYRTLSDIGDLPPFGGSFLTGGVVPGAPGEARTVIAHGGETITPPDAGQVHEHNVILTPKVRGLSLENLIDVRVEHKTRNMARGAKVRPGARAGQLGRR